MLQKNFTANEPQFMCDVCSEAVINPLCPFCLKTEIEAWLTLYPNLRYDLLPQLRKYLQKIDSEANPSTRCISCGYDSTFLCPYCFTEFVLNELKKIHANKIVLKEFFQFFNFDFEHNGYSKEAEELGFI
jgi:hypothetical protein